MPKRILFDEQSSVEEPTKKLFEDLGWETKNCYHETYGSNGTLGRETRSEVVLVKRLKKSIKKLNPDISDDVLDIAVQEIIHDRSTMTLAGANRFIYKEFLKDGVKVEFSAQNGEQTTKNVKIIDWENPDNNDFFLAQQFWITGDLYTRRADLIGFINGIPLVFIELKASFNKVEDAYYKNLLDYKEAIPHVFWYNGFIILSNGSEAKIGSTTAGWEHFNDWKKINEQGEKGIVPLETIIRGTCEKKKLLDLLENFILFSDEQGGVIKLLAKNHQYFGVNNSVKALKSIKEKKGKLGVFWHTQGSGKSVSMMYFSKKVLRKIPGSWTFVIVTDRNELDDQIYKTFANAEVVTEPQRRVRAQSRRHLQTLLQQDHRFVFTTLQKFWIDKKDKFPKLTDRSDIIVITDEAHRSQYDTFALNMRSALPKASFLGFTGTPLILGDKVTKDVFGQYVSVYNFKESIDDKATVPLYYENRIPEVQLKKEEFNSGIVEILEEAELNVEQEKKLQRDFARQYQIITRDDRLEKVAEDIVEHFIERGFMGKAMVMSIDKATAVRMYDKVKKHWKIKIANFKDDLRKAIDGDEKESLNETIKYMEETDMAVVVSPGQNEIKQMAKFGLDIRPHRERINKEDLDKKFKDPEDPFRIVFLCAMWMVGFDVPSCSTLYIDKPMKNHSLMQALARANRVYPGKTAGSIVDYVGVFQNIRKALAIYGEGSGGQIESGDMPIVDKKVIIESLRDFQKEFVKYFERLEVDLLKFEQAKDYELIKVLDNVVDTILSNEEDVKEFIAHHNSYIRIYKAILPDKTASEFSKFTSIIRAIARKIRFLRPGVSIEHIREKVEYLLDKTIVPDDQKIRDKVKEGYKVYDISKLNVKKLKEKFVKEKNKHREAEIIKKALNERIIEMVELNKSREELLKKFELLIEEYNAGKYGLVSFFDELIKFAKELNQEEQRAVSEQLSEEELAIMDILMKPAMTLTKKEKEKVKEIAKRILERLKKANCFSLDWRKKQRSRAMVRNTIRKTLEELPYDYSMQGRGHVLNSVFTHVYDSYFGPGKSMYTIN